MTELNTFVEHFNTRVDTIKFTHETSVKAVLLQDGTIKLNNDALEKDLYCKPRIHMTIYCIVQNTFRNVRIALLTAYLSEVE